MRMSHRLVGAVCAALVIVGAAAWLSSPVARAGSDDISGTIRSAAGPEAGVWVIAETNDLQTKFIKIVVTDDQGNFVLPELPNATYNVWVRGYGLVDSMPVSLKPSATKVGLKATAAKTPQEAAKVYP